VRIPGATGDDGGLGDAAAVAANGVAEMAEAHRKLAQLERARAERAAASVLAEEEDERARAEQQRTERAAQGARAARAE
jgi:hypothetical protein